MLERKDYQKYMQQMKEVETAIHDLYAKSIESIDDSLVKEVFLKIMSDEERHIRMTEELAKIFGVAST